MTNFPKKVFQGDDYEKPLDILGKECNLCSTVYLNIFEIYYILFPNSGVYEKW